MAPGSISVVIPALDEERAIAGVIEEMRALESELGDTVFEIIVIDDGSTDGTGETARGAGADRVIRHPYPGGYGQSLKKGILAASHDTIITTDADGTYPVKAIPEMLELYAAGNDMVVGMRTGKVYVGGPFKGPMRRILRFLVEYTSGQKIPDVNSGLRIFSKSTMSLYLNRLCDTFSFSTSSTLAYLMNRRFISYVQIDYHERIGQSKVRIFRDSIRTLQYIVEAMAYYNPFKLFLLVAMILLVTSGLLFLINMTVDAATMGLFSLATFSLSVIASLAGLLSVVIKGHLTSADPERK